MTRTGLLATAASFTVCFASSAEAQTAQPDKAPLAATATENAGLADIIVTASRRSESSQRAAIPLTAVNGDTLAAKGVIQPENLNTAVAGLALSPNGAITQVYLRGVGTFSGPVGDSSVLVSLDQVVLNSPSMISGNFYDLERVEVLKGPQGTLYGRNATAGAINIITKKPRLGELSGDAAFEIGNYDLYHADGAINVPFGDTFAVRAAGQIVRRNGYFTDGSGDDNSEAARLQAKWEPRSGVNLLLSGDYTNSHGRGSPYVVVPFVDPDHPFVGPSTPLGNSRLQSARTNGAPPSFPAGTPFPLVANDSLANAESYGARGELNWDLGGPVLTAISAYRHITVDQRTYPGFVLPAHATEEETTGELRLASASGGTLKWLIGGFYFHDDSRNRFNVDQGISAQNNDVSTKIESYAAFGEATYSIAAPLRLTAGLRYTHEDRTQRGTSQPIVPPGLPLASYPGVASFGNVTYKAGVEYDVAPRSLLYATLSTGFRSGGLNPDIAPNTYRPEKLTAFTLGSKNRFFDNTLQLNVEAFYWSYKEHQENVLAPLNNGGFGILIQNIGKASLKGANVDLQYQLDKHNMFTAQVEYLDATFDDYSYTSPLPQVALAGRTTCTVTTPTSPTNPAGLPFIAPARVNCDGKPFTRAPKWSALLSYQHVFMLGNDGRIAAGVNGQFSSAYFTATDYLPDQRQGSYALLGVNVGYTAPSSKWSLTFYGRNLTNKAVLNSSFEHPFIPGLVYATLKPPRTYGASLQIHF